MNTNVRSNLMFGLSCCVIIGITIAAWAQSSSESKPETSVIKVFTLQNIVAADCVQMLQELVPTAQFSVDSRTNSVICTAPADQNQKVEQILKKLEAIGDSSAQKALAQTSAKQRLISTSTASPIEFPDFPQIKSQFESLSQLEQKAQKIAEGIRNQAQGESDVARKELDQTLEAALAVKIELENQQVRSLEERLARLKSQVARRAESKQKIIERRAAELLESDALKWSTPEPPSVAKALSSPPYPTFGPPSTVEGENKSSEQRGSSPQAFRSLFGTWDDLRASADSTTHLSTYRFNQDMVGELLNQVNDQIKDAESRLKNSQKSLELAVARGDEKQIEAAKKLIVQRTRTLKERRRPLEDYAAELKDLKLEVEAAQAQYQFAEKNYQSLRSKSLPNTPSVEEAMLKLRQAEIAMNRQKNRYEHFKKAGEDFLPVEASSTLSTSFQDVSVLVAKTRIDVGAALSASNVEMQKWPKYLVPDGAVTSNDQWADRTLASPLAAGMPVLVRQLGDKGKGEASNTVSDSKPPSTEGISSNSNRLPDQIRATERYKQARQEQAKPDSLEECLNVLSTSTDFKRIEKAMQQIDKRIAAGELKDRQDQSRVCEALMRTASRIYGNKEITGSKDHIMKVGDTQSDPWFIVGRMISRFTTEARSPVLLKILRENEPRAKGVALKSLTPIWHYVECEEFPNLCEMALASGASEDSSVRIAAIDLLCNSLAISQRGAAAFNSQELQGKAKKLADALPPEKIIAMVSSALNDQNPSTALATARVVISRSGAIEGSQQGANFDASTLIDQTVDTLLQLVGGDLRGRNVDGNERRRALSLVSDIRSHQALVASRLIELLKSNKLDFRATANDSRITRNEILEVLSSKLASHARGALPFIEDQLLLISLEQGENSKDVTKLRELISRLKSENATEK